MKRKTGVILISITLILIIIYLLLPSSGQVNFSRDVQSSSPTIYRSITNQALWKKWFGSDIVIKERLLNSANITVSTGNLTASGNIMLLSLDNDSTRVFCSAELANYNRFTGYFQLRKLSNKVRHALDSIKYFAENTANVYGITIRQQSTIDTLLLTRRFNTTSYPSTEIIYSQIEQLRKEVLSKGATATGFPMLNVTPVDSSTYKCMIALPIDKVIGNDSSFVRMIPGQFLTGEIKGGPHTISNAHVMMQQYFSDFKRAAMAIPFEYLVTNRLQEPDTTKWVTKIYFPVF